MKQFPLRAMVLLLSVLALSGCVNDSHFYQPSTSQVHPPKPKDQPIPVFGKIPDRKHQVIGRIAFQSTRDHASMVRAVESAARKHGADAAILLPDSGVLVQPARPAPGDVAREPVVSGVVGINYVSSNAGLVANRRYRTGYATSYQSARHQGGTTVGTTRLHQLDALLIVWK